MKPAQIGRTCQHHWDGKTGRIGNGFFGEVFTARITERGDYTGQDVVVVKRVYMKHTQFLEDTNNFARYQQRLQAIFCLTHDNLMKYHKVSVYPQLVGATFEFMMDYYPYGNLRARLDMMKNTRTLLDPAKAVRYSVDLASGLSFLHQNNLTHGDLKPENVLIDCADGRPEKLLISDLDGIVTILRGAISSLSNGHWRTSMRYMSPEMLDAFTPAAQHDVWSAIPAAKTDVWSAGCIALDLIRCITGDHQELLRNPVTGQVMGQERRLSTMAFLVAVSVHHCIPVINAPPPVPPLLAECVRRCLQVDINDRLSAETLLKELLSMKLN
ncbi:uncharacterized protein LOC129595133 [Paramacrobiotus metropolitanus]|uniref:uncharacterized protein LOC129595133 n=1 Tax=Paramacrobiotus metropolitanus TaxID=2943436 RepID=UPI002445832C|nr:uncharacterized protein LOC129595133 [Paramacrobiotus metropolitanus]